MSGQIARSASQNSPGSRGTTCGAALGSSRTWIEIDATNRAMISAAGIAAAMNSAPTELSVRIAYSTRGAEGGTSWPNVPPAAMLPVDKASEYPWRRISGWAALPMVSAVAIDEPVMAPNPAQAPMVASASPPRNEPRTAWARR